MSQTTIDKSTRVNTGNRRDSVAHKAILDAARQIITERGPNGFAMEAIAKAAGVGKATIYRWWPDRVELLIELLNREILPVPAIPNDATLLEELTLRMEDLFGAWRETPAGKVFRSLMIEMQSTTENVERFRKEALAPRRNQSMKAFIKAQQRGEISPTADLEALLDMLYGWAWFRLLTGQLVPDQSFHNAIKYLSIAAKGAGNIDYVN